MGRSSARQHRSPSFFPGRPFDILRFERRGEDFALVRVEADGARSELLMTAANVVHLGFLAPGFSRQVLTDRLGRQPGSVARFVRHTAMNANLRIIEILLTILDQRRGTPRLPDDRSAGRGRWPRSWWSEPIRSPLLRTSAQTTFPR